MILEGLAKAKHRRKYRSWWTGMTSDVLSLALRAPCGRPKSLPAILSNGLTGDILSPALRALSLCSSVQIRSQRICRLFVFLVSPSSKRKTGPTRGPVFVLLAEWTGLEPATPGVTGRYSNQLNYHSVYGGC